MIVVANTAEIAEKLTPGLADNNTLTEDLMEYLGDRDLSTLNRRLKPWKDAGATPQDLVSGLITLCAPESVTSLRTTQNRFELGPIDDFESFVTSIDYGKVVARDEKKWAIRIKIRPEEATPEKLLQRLDRFVDPPPMVRRLRRLLTPEKEEAFERPSRPSRFREDPDEFAEDRLGAIDVGDYAMLDIGKVEIAVRVDQLKKKWRDEVIRVVLHDALAVGKQIKNRALRRRVEQAKEVKLWVPADRLRRLNGPPAPKPEEREWVDKTGRFKVMAVYDGVEGDRVKLRKADGKMSRVPLRKLSEADQKYVAALQASGEANPFASSGRSAGRSLKADWSEAKQVKARKSRKWKFNPSVEDPARPIAPSVVSLGIDHPNPNSRSSVNLRRMWVAADGSRVVVQVESEDRQHLQVLDFANGVTEEMVACPKDSWVLDVSRDTERVLLRRGGWMGGDNTRVYIQRLTSNGLEPICDWDANPPGNTHKRLQDARFLFDNRVLTYEWQSGWTAWDAQAAKAIYRVNNHGKGEKTHLDSSGRYAFFGGGKSVVVVDMATGEHSASIPHGLSLSSVTVDAEMNRLAIAGINTRLSTGVAATIDLGTGDLIAAVEGGLVRHGRLQFVDDFLLIDDEYLIEPDYPVLLWQYAYKTRDRQSVQATVRAGRLWYAIKEPSSGGLGGGWRVTSVPAPHGAVTNRLAKLGGVQSLIILEPGDEVTVEADTDLPEADSQELLKRLRAGLTDAGYRVVDEIGPGVKRAVVVCKQATKPVEVRIVNPNAKKPAGAPGPSERISSRFGGLDHQEWRYHRRSIKPYYTLVEIREGEDLLWSDANRIGPNAIIYPIKGETTDQVIKRLEKRNLGRLETISFPGRICRRGNVTRYGAYGASVLGGEGVVADYLKKPND